MTVGVAFGSVLYRVVLFFALKVNFLDNVDMKLMSAVLVVTALILSHSKGAHALVTKLTPWKGRTKLPAPMAVEPNQFSPFALVDSGVQKAHSRGRASVGTKPTGPGVPLSLYGESEGDR
jgi:hypothetical protein